MCNMINSCAQIAHVSFVQLPSLLDQFQVDPGNATTPDGNYHVFIISVKLFFYYLRRIFNFVNRFAKKKLSIV